MRRDAFKNLQNKVKHKGKDVSTLLGSKKYESLLRSLRKDIQEDVGYIPRGYEGRPDRISNTFYNSPDLWWFVQIANNVIDPFEGFKVNQKIRLPKL